MAAVGLGRQDVTTYLRDGVIFGCENSTKIVTLTGDLDVLEEVVGATQKDHPGILVRRLHVECAYHSHHMKQWKPNTEPFWARPSMRESLHLSSSPLLGIFCATAICLLP